MYLFKLVFLFLLDKYPEVKLLDHIWEFCFNFLRIFLTVFHKAAPMYVTPTGHECSLFFTSSPTLVSCHFDDSHPNRCEVLSHCGFQFGFPWLVMSSIFSCTCWPFVCLLWKNLNSDSLPIFKSDCLIFFLLSCMSHILCLSVPSLQPSFVSVYYFNSYAKFFSTFLSYFVSDYASYYFYIKIYHSVHQVKTDLILVK